MKTLTLLFTLTTFAAIAQTTRIADNNPNAPMGTNIYRGATALQDAINAAAVGDIVYVQPSVATYGDITINKRITLRGIGFNTGKDLGLVSITGNIGLTNTLDNTSNASGTIIEGIQASTSNGRIYLGFKTGTFDYVLKNVTLNNCSFAYDGIFRSYGYMPVENLTIKNCFAGIYFEPTGSVTNLFVYRNFLYQIYLNDGSLSSAIFSNNITDRGSSNRFGIGCCGYPALNISSLVITNNNFLGETDISGTAFMEYGLSDALVSNNIFYGCTPSKRNFGIFERNAFTNNLSFGTSNDALPPGGTGVGNTGANNKVGQDPKFVNAPFNTLWAATWDFTLQAGSPAKNAGTDGTDIGITGGTYGVNKNLDLRATSAPVIIQFNPAAIVPQNQPLKANIKAKAN